MHASWLVGAVAGRVAVALAPGSAARSSGSRSTIPLPRERRGRARRRSTPPSSSPRRLGATVTTVHSFEQLPPPGATLVLARGTGICSRAATRRCSAGSSGRPPGASLQSALVGRGRARRAGCRSQQPSRRDRGERSAAPGDGGGRRRGAERDSSRVAPCMRRQRPLQALRRARRRRRRLRRRRRYRVCGWRDPRSCSAHARRRGRSPATRARSHCASPLGRGDITANALDRSFDNAALDARRRRARVRGDAAAAPRRPRLVRRRRNARAAARRCSGSDGAPALAARAGRARARALARRRALRPAARRAGRWRAARSASRSAAPPRSSRAGGGAALHAASVRALEEEARRSIANYAALLGGASAPTRSRSKTRRRPGRARAAMAPPRARPHEHRRARSPASSAPAARSLPERRRSCTDPPLHDPSPP